MTTEILATQCAMVGRQLERCFEGLSTELWEAREPSTAMSPRETALHLAEAYRALTAHLSGRRHPWGSFSIDDPSPQGALACWRAEREQAVAAALASDRPDLVPVVTDYILLHDAYHVGQLAALRIRLEGWDSSAVYRA